MTAPTPSSAARSARERFASRFRTMRGEHVRAFARAIEEPAPESGRLVCWGELARRFEAAFTTDEQRIESLAAFVIERDLRALLLFAHAARENPTVLDAMLERASELPISIQRALVTMVDPSMLSPNVRDGLAASARQLLDEGDAAIGREREVVEARIAELLSFGIVAPDSVDPRELGQVGTHDDGPAEGGAP